MSRTVRDVPAKHWSVRRLGSVIGLYPWDYEYGHVMYDLRFFAGCKRTPQVVRRELITRGTWTCRIYAGQGVAAGCGRYRRTVVRTAEREYNDSVRDLWNAGEEIDDLLEPADSRHGAILWDIW